MKNENLLHVFNEFHVFILHSATGRILTVVVPVPVFSCRIKTCSSRPHSHTGILVTVIKAEMKGQSK